MTLMTVRTTQVAYNNMITTAANYVAFMKYLPYVLAVSISLLFLTSQFSLAVFISTTLVISVVFYTLYEHYIYLREQYYESIARFAFYEEKKKDE